ncbi:sulfotransferase family protein [Streptomyces sp. NPDC127051]|uniref:sulfotransferase family protein n=1 Tax=Streptomyces sp. NPDC127051 TaxID=3347119 RepID=UPI0036538BD8
MLRQHPDILSVNELLSSVAPHGLVERPVPGRAFWRLLAAPHPLWNTMIRSSVPLPELSYLGEPGRFSAEAGGIPALSMTVLPHLSAEPDVLFDYLGEEVRSWPERPAKYQYTALFDLLRAQSGGRVTVERSGNSLQWLPWIRKTFPDARVVHLYRDGVNSAASMHRHPCFRMSLLLEDAARYAGVPSPRQLTRSVVDRVPADLRWLFEDRFDPRLLMERPISVARFGALWTRSVLAGLCCLRQLPASQRMDLSYEELVVAPEKELARLARFAGVAPHRGWLAAGRTVFGCGPGRRDSVPLALSPVELAALRDACAPAIRALGQ